MPQESIIITLNMFKTVSAVVWFDPKVNIGENLAWQKKYLQGTHEYYCFEDHHTALAKIRELIPTRRVLIITCGSRGEYFCRDLIGEQIEGVVVFTSDVEIIKKWNPDHKKRVVMVSQNSTEVFVDGIALLKSLSKEKKKKCLTVGITGATRSGKSILATNFKNKYGCSLIHQDNYCNEVKVQK
jgi:hypothetical protein